MTSPGTQNDRCVYSRVFNSSDRFFSISDCLSRLSINVTSDVCHCASVPNNAISTWMQGKPRVTTTRVRNTVNYGFNFLSHLLEWRESVRKKRLLVFQTLNYTYRQRKVSLRYKAELAWYLTQARNYDPWSTVECTITFTTFMKKSIVDIWMIGNSSDLRFGLDFDRLFLYNFIETWVSFHSKKMLFLQLSNSPSYHKFNHDPSSDATLTEQLKGYGDQHSSRIFSYRGSWTSCCIFLISIQITLFASDWIFNFSLRMYPITPYSGFYSGGPAGRQIENQSMIMVISYS